MKTGVWFVAAGVGVLVWTALVHWNPPDFYAWASLYCAVWLGLSWRALGAGGRPWVLPRRDDVLWGVTSAGVLYVGTRGVLWAFCGGLSTVLCEPLRDIYLHFGSGWGAAVALVLVLTPAEELFWRGVVQQAFRPKLGPVGAALGAAGLSSLVLLFFGEPLLALAAFPTSVVWGLLAEWRRSLVASWVSHALWDLLIVVLAPALRV